MTEQQAKERVVKAGHEVIETGLVDGTWGNISVRIDRDYMAITPSGRDYTTLKPEDIVVVNIETGEAHGGKPSTETPFHREIYRTRPNVGAIVHTHSMSASTVAAAGRDVPPILDDFAQVVGPSLRVAPHAIPGSKKITRGAIKALAGRNACLLANHGAIAVGPTMEDALLCARMVEKGCRAFIEASFLGGAKSVGTVSAWAMHQFYLKKYSKLKNAPSASESASGASEASK